MEKYDKKGDVSYTLGTTLTFELLLRKPEVATRIYIHPKQKRDATYEKMRALTAKANIPFITNNQKIFSSVDNSNVISFFSYYVYSANTAQSLLE